MGAGATASPASEIVQSAVPQCESVFTLRKGVMRKPLDTVAFRNFVRLDLEVPNPVSSRSNIKWGEMLPRPVWDDFSKSKRRTSGKIPHEAFCNGCALCLLKSSRKNQGRTSTSSGCPTRSPRWSSRGQWWTNPSYPTHLARHELFLSRQSSFEFSVPLLEERRPDFIRSIDPCFPLFLHLSPRSRNETLGYF